VQATSAASAAATTTTWDALRDMGCDIAQGYVISCPLPADQLAVWLTTVTPVPVGIAR
jgi:EAL domain-containing protein (putative c-di-GMP-specific phosphodiesterase class I)